MTSGKDKSKKRFKYKNVESIDAVFNYVATINKGLKTRKLGFGKDDDMIEMAMPNDVELRIEAETRKGKGSLQITVNWETPEPAEVDDVDDKKKKKKKNPEKRGKSSEKRQGDVAKPAKKEKKSKKAKERGSDAPDNLAGDTSGDADAKPRKSSVAQQAAKTPAPTKPEGSTTKPASSARVKKKPAPKKKPAARKAASKKPKSKAPAQKPKP